MIVYAIVLRETKDSEHPKVYVGSAVDEARRLAVHRSAIAGHYHHNRHLMAAVQKRGWDAFELVVLEEFDDPVQRFVREKHWFGIYAYAEHECRCHGYQRPYFNIACEPRGGYGPRTPGHTRKIARANHIAAKRPQTRAKRAALKDKIDFVRACKDASNEWWANATPKQRREHAAKTSRAVSDFMAREKDVALQSDGTQSS